MQVRDLSLDLQRAIEQAMQMRRVLIIGGLALALLGAPMAIEAMVEPMTPLELGLDVLEVMIFAATIATVALLTLEMREVRRDRNGLARDLSEARAENIKWRENSRAQIEGLRHAIHQQFDDWGFTAAEKDIAGLLLKGCSHKQIAEVRQSNVSTVRQQAQAIYRKSGQQNRSELAAYFLDAIVEPGAVADGRASAPLTSVG